ncbi:ABC transporter substrate-binding protein [Rhodoferax sp.]|uniref:substrate-binding periplasmic protein n=1 Tax=Rhodoferax sp. TaxID=50421 RepID=UPI002ACDBDF4|nr:ABC transporter substrate-binding protein [Rhodoferax sp.]MDZ7922322.1 ABC transporter substrate-binding protein [Rhodoferax sp.]
MAFPLRSLLTLMLLALALQVNADTLPPYQIVSGNLPPFTAESGPEAPGALGTLVREMAQRLGEPPPIQFYPWTRALNLVSTQPRTLVLPLTRTPEREAHYRWLVKLYRQQFVFIALRSASVPVDTVDRLRDLRIAVLRGSPNEGQLISRHFKHIVPANSVLDMARMLERGMADAIYGGDAINLAVLADYGIASSQLRLSKPLEYGEIWLGGSLDIPESEALLWQNAMKQLVRDGVVRRTLARYGLPQ